MQVSHPNNADQNFYQNAVNAANYIAKGNTKIADGQILTHCGMQIPYFNNHFITDAAVLSEKPWSTPTGFFEEKNLDYQIVLPDAWADIAQESILKHGFICDGSVPAMLFDADTTPLKPPVAYDALDIRLVDDLQTYAAFKKVCGPAFGMQDFVAERMLTADYLNDKINRLFVGFFQGEAVSTSVLTVSHDVAGIYWVTTDQTQRGKGFGEALAYHATKAGLEEGLRFASLQATPMGAPIYLRMGYQTHYHYRKYLKKLSARSG